MKPETKRYTSVVGTKTVTFETGKLAGQAGGAVTVGIDESIVFAAATMARSHQSSHRSHHIIEGIISPSSGLCNFTGPGQVGFNA